jgi:hypothetical protein
MEVVAAALTLLERLPEPPSRQTRSDYLRVFQRCWRSEAGLVTPATWHVRDTYGVLVQRSITALASSSGHSLRTRRVSPRADPSETERAGEALIVAARRLWPVLAQHPLRPAAVTTILSHPGRHTRLRKPFRGAGSKKRDLPVRPTRPAMRLARPGMGGRFRKSGYISDSGIVGQSIRPASTCLPEKRRAVARGVGELISGDS